MTMHFEHQTLMPASAERVFAYHESPGAFQRINPAWEKAQMIEQHGGIQDGAEVHLRFKLGPVTLPWRLRHQNYRAGRHFEDVQVSGPFAQWQHQHHMLPQGDHNSLLHDQIRYQLPFGGLGRALAGGFAQARLRRMFSYRHEVTAQDLQTQQAYPGDPLKIVVTGASGLVGQQLVPFLSSAGHQVIRLVRREARSADEAYWNPATNTLDPAIFEGVDAVIHLAGESIAEGRWTAAKKRRILESRVQGTRLLAETLAALPQAPRVLISASGIGIYSDQGEKLITEDSPYGDSFLAEVCKAWEGACQPAEAAGLRVVNLRFGIILSMGGGALARMLLPFQLGVGGRLSSGKQYMSWVALDDVIGIIYHALHTESLRGGVLVAAPASLRNQEFTRILGRVLQRPTLFPIPAFGLRLLFGQMVDELLLSSQRTQPEKLLNSGYRFRYPSLEAALRHLLGRQQAHEVSAPQHQQPQPSPAR